MARKPPRVTSTRRQPTTHGGPRVTSRTRQPTTGAAVDWSRVLGSRGPSWWSGYGGQAPKPPAGGAPAAGAASSTPTPPQYSVNNLPPDASYDAALALLARQRAEQVAQLAQQRSSTLLDYGFTEGPNGTLAVDPRNPFSKAALLKKSYDTSRRSTGNQMASGGQLYSGAYQNAQDLISRNQLQSQDQMQKALGAFLARNTQQRGGALSNFELGAQQAYADRVGRFQSNPLYDPASADSMAAGASSGASTASSAPASAAAVPKPSTSRRPRRPRGVGVSAWSGYYRP